MVENQENIENTEVQNEVIEGKSIASILGGDSNDSRDKPDNKNDAKTIVEKEEPIEGVKNEEEKQELKPEIDIDKLQKNLKETQSWGHAKAREAKEVSKKLEATEAQLKEYIESGALTPEEGDVALKHTAHNRPEDVQTLLTEGQELDHILNQTIPRALEFNTDPNARAYVEAFYHMTNNIPEKDLQKLSEDLARVKKDPVLMTKNAIELGKQYYNDFYGELSEAGGIYAMTGNYRNKLSEKQKTIDKLKKDIVKLQQNSDYTGTAGYSIPSGSSDKANTVRNRSLDGIFGRAKSGKI